MDKHPTVVEVTQKCKTCGSLLLSTATYCGFCYSKDIVVLKQAEHIRAAEYLKP